MHLPGNFDSCLEADAGRFKGKYCLLGMVPDNGQPGVARDQLAGVARAQWLGFPEAAILHPRGPETTRIPGTLSTWMGVVMFCPCLFCPSDNFETCLGLPMR